MPTLRERAQVHGVTLHGEAHAWLPDRGLTLLDVHAWRNTSDELRLDKLARDNGLLSARSTEVAFAWLPVAATFDSWDSASQVYEMESLFRADAPPPLLRDARRGRQPATPDVISELREMIASACASPGFSDQVTIV